MNGKPCPEFTLEQNLHAAIQQHVKPGQMKCYGRGYSA